jgi:co-chaperonin GroES (HSP10)
MSIKPINRIFCKILERENENGIILSDSQNLLDKYSIAEVKISNDDEYTVGMKVIIPSFSDKFEHEGEKYNVIHRSDIIAICE